MYQLKAEVYLDRYNECYKKVIVIFLPLKDKVLKHITKLTNREKLSPFQERSPCCPEDQCYYIVLNPKQTCEFLCVNQINLLFNYLLSNGYSIDTSVTKIMQDSDVKIQNLICFISKN
jgi:hypothetical protein